MVLNILNALPFSIYWIQSSTRILSGCNKYFLSSHNYNDISEIIDKSIHIIFSKNHCRILNNLLKKKYEETKENSNIYFDLIDTSQRLLFIQCSKIPFIKDLVVFSEIFIDIEALNQSLWREKENLNIYLNNIVECIPVSVYWKDRNYTILGGSQLHAELAGYSDRKEVVGKNDYDFVWKNQAKNIIKNDQFVMDKNETVVFEEEAVLRDGSLHTFLTRKSPLKGKLGETIGVLGISIDITELKETQSALTIALNKAEAANQAKTEFLENMRHDIRTPLSGIVGCAQLIQMQAHDPKKVAEYAEDLVQSSDALLEFLNKILESIQVASGEIPLLKKRFNLYQVLNQIIQLNKPEARIKHLKLQLDYDKTIPDYLLGDPIRVQRIILELVTNALKFTDKGEVKITASLGKNKTQSGQVIVSLSVSDTGMGIPLAQQNEVYTRFKRLTPSYQGIYPGTGLGLAVVKQFIDDLGGEIHLDSKPKQGSTFTCLIPLQESLSVKNEADEGRVEKTSFNVLDTHFSNKNIEKIAVEEETILKTGSRILVVEDNPIAVKVAQGILSGLNCQTDMVEDGKTALTAIEKNPYDLILMDIGLPDGDGCEVTRRIRLKQWQRNPSIPIIGLTAHITEEKKRRCLNNGMNAIYTKPLTANKAAEILNAFLSHSEASNFPKDEPKQSSDKLEWLPILDRDQALKLLNSEEMVNQMLALLENELTKELAYLQQHHQANDWSMIRGLAHKWQGGASYCGASRLVKVCQQLEASLRTGSLPQEENEKLYQQLLQVAKETIEATEKFIAAK